MNKLHCKNLEVGIIRSDGLREKILEVNDWELGSGEFVGISGASGSGKSYFFKTLTGFKLALGGKVEFNNESISTYKLSDYRKQVYYCSQDPIVGRNTVYDALSFPYYIRKIEPNREKMIELLNQVNLPKEVLGENVGQLSGGQRQRTSLIRYMLFPSKFMLLDEITSGLDKENRDIILNLLRWIIKKENIGIAFITHDDMIDDADRIFKIVNGQLREDT